MLFKLFIRRALLIVYTLNLGNKKLVINVLLIILKKPQKPDYSEPKAYRPIALLDTLGKALEAVISTRIREYAEANRFLLEEQIGARKGRSVETALELITDTIYIV